jgi:hypothetical protein
MAMEFNKSVDSKRTSSYSIPQLEMIKTMEVQK